MAPDPGEGGGKSGRAAAPASRRPSVRPFPGWRGRRRAAARSVGRADGRPVLSPLLVRLPRWLAPARPPLPPPRPRPLAHRDRRRGRCSSGRPQAPAGLESGGWNPPGALNSRAPRCCVSASSWGPGPGGRSGGRGRAGPSGGRARLAGAGGRRGPDGRGRQPDGRAAGAGLRDPLRRSRFPHKLPESGASAALLPASSSPANQRRAPRPAPPISRPALRWPRQPIRPSAPPPGLRPIRTVGRSSQRRGQHEAAGGRRCGEWWGLGGGVRCQGWWRGVIFLCGLLGFFSSSLEPETVSHGDLTLEPQDPQLQPPPREILSCPRPDHHPLYIPLPSYPSLLHPLEKKKQKNCGPRNTPPSSEAAAPRAKLREDQPKNQARTTPLSCRKGPRLQRKGPDC